MVGSDSYAAGGSEASQELVDVGGIEEASLVVSFLRPGVWEVDVETIRAFVRQDIGYKGGGIGADYAYIGQAPSANAVDRVAVVFAGPLDAEEVGLGVGLSLVEKEGASADADFDVKGGRTSEKASEVDSAIQVLDIKRNVRIVF